MRDPFRQSAFSAVQRFVYWAGIYRPFFVSGGSAINLNQVTLPVDTIDPATAFYRRMGFLQIVDTPHYARFECPMGDSTFSLALEPSSKGAAVVYFEHPQLDHWVEELQAKGFEFAQLPTDMPYLWREAILYDPAGNKLKLYWAGEARTHPPWRVELGDNSSTATDKDAPE